MQAHDYIKCHALDLANISFAYYDNEIDFYITEYKQYWQLMVTLYVRIVVM